MNNIFLSRKQFLISFASFALYPIFSKATTQNKFLLTGCRSASKNFLIKINLQNYKMEHYDSPGNIHELIWHKINPNIVITVPQWKTGTEGAIGLFSLKENRFIKKIFPPSINHQFVGHGLYDPDQQVLWAGLSRYNKKYEHQEGLLAKIDILKSGKILSLIPTDGVEPHQILLDENKLIIAHSGTNHLNIVGESSLVIIEKKSEKIVKKNIIAPKGMAAFGHMLKNDHHQYILCGGESSIPVRNVTDLHPMLMTFQNGKFSASFRNDKIQGVAFVPALSHNKIAFNVYQNKEVYHSDYPSLNFSEIDFNSVMPKMNLSGSTFIFNDKFFFTGSKKLLIVDEKKRSTIYQFPSLPGIFGAHSIVLDAHIF